MLSFWNHSLYNQQYSDESRDKRRSLNAATPGPVASGAGNLENARKFPQRHQEVLVIMAVGASHLGIPMFSAVKLFCVLVSLAMTGTKTKNYVLIL